MSAHVILTVAGSDRPGLTRSLADAVAAVGGNWLESHLATLGGQYVGSVLVELAEDRIAALEAEASRIDAAGLSVRVIPAAAEPHAAGRSLALDLVGQDRPGIIREVTTVLANLGVNIDDLDTGVEDGAWSGARLFRARARLSVPDVTDADAVTAALEAISAEVMVDLSVTAA